MDVRHPTAPADVTGLPTEELRARFLAEGLTAAPGPALVYSHHDRMIIGGVRVGAGDRVTLGGPEGSTERTIYKYVHANGTRNYSFVWAMGGENQAYDDVEVVAVQDMR